MLASFGRLVDFASFDARLGLGFPKTRSFFKTRESASLDFDRFGFGAKIEENKKQIINFRNFLAQLVHKN